MEGFFAILKRDVVGTFHHVSEAHLARYLAEFDFRYSNCSALGINDTMRTDEQLRGYDPHGPLMDQHTLGLLDHESCLSGFGLRSGASTITSASTVSVLPRFT